jgi:hypothetical protein
MVSVFDTTFGYKVGEREHYRFALSTEDESLLEQLSKYRDSIPGEQAFEKRIAHWGTQRWGGLTLKLQDSRALYMESGIDVFAPESRGKLSRRFVVAAYSEDSAPS